MKMENQRYVGLKPLVSAVIAPLSTSKSLNRGCVSVDLCQPAREVNASRSKYHTEGPPSQAAQCGIHRSKKYSLNAFYRPYKQR